MWDVGLVHCMQSIVVGRLHVGCGACALHVWYGIWGLYIVCRVLW